MRLEKIAVAYLPRKIFHASRNLCGLVIPTEAKSSEEPALSERRVRTRRSQTGTDSPNGQVPAMSVTAI